MKKRFLALCVAASMSAMLMACGSSTDEKEESGIQVEKIEESNDDSQEEAADSKESEKSEDATAEVNDNDGTADTIEASSDSEEGKYVVFTDASNAEVEAYAEKVVSAALAKDWDTIGDMIEYPIGAKEFNNVCNNKDEFVAYANSTGFDESYFTSLTAWDMTDLWGNYQGACIDNGNIWFRDINIDNPEFKIVSFFGMPEGVVEGSMEGSDSAATDTLGLSEGLWQTTSIGYTEDDGETMQPDFYVQFTDSDIEYGHMQNDKFVLDHADKISSVETVDSGFRVQAQSDSGVQYTYQTSEEDDTMMEYYETWNEDEFADKYSGGASLMRNN